MKEVALITLHGMGKVKPDYYDELEKELKKELGSEWTKVSFQNVQYAPILQQPEDELWQAMMSEPSNDLDATRLRQFSFMDLVMLVRLNTAHTDGKISILQFRRKSSKPLNTPILISAGIKIGQSSLLLSLLVVRLSQTTYGTQSMVSIFSRITVTKNARNHS